MENIRDAMRTSQSSCIRKIEKPERIRNRRCSIFKDHLKDGLKQKKTQTNGGVAQLGEHLPCKQGVRGSIPLISTK